MSSHRISYASSILRSFTIWQLFAGQSIIQISGSRWIDGEDALLPAGEALLSDHWMHTDRHHASVAVPPQISPGAQFLRRDGPGQVLGQALQHLAGEVGKIDIILHEDALCLRLDLSGLAQRLSQSPDVGGRKTAGWLSRCHLPQNKVCAATLTLLQSCCLLASRWSDIWTGCYCSRLHGWQSLGDSRRGGRWSAAPGGPQGRTWQKACRGGTWESLLQLWSVSSQQCTRPEERLTTKKGRKEGLQEIIIVKSIFLCSKLEAHFSGLLEYLPIRGGGWGLLMLSCKDKMHKLTPVAQLAVKY